MLSPQRTNVLLLALCQALLVTGMSVIAIASALVGQALAADKSLATLPLALLQLAVMMTALPASLLMRRIGRRAGFSIGAVLGLLGGLLQAEAVYRPDCGLYCLGNVLFGIAAGFALFYRVAATDTADAAFKSKAISLVMAGGVIASVAGPALARWSNGWLAPVGFAGCFLAIAVLQGLAGLLIQFVRIPRPNEDERQRAGRPLSTIMRQPIFLVSVLGGTIGYGVMSLVMTATPLAMIDCSYSFPDTAFVIQWHMLGMFVPSFFTGHLIARSGVLRVMLAGAGLLAGCVLVNLSGTAIWQFWAGLVLLGTGWNFLYIGASSLLTESYRPEERAKTQGANDFLVFGVVTVACLASGVLHNLYGWQALNAAVLLPIGLAAAAILWLSRRRGTFAERKVESA